MDCRQSYSWRICSAWALLLVLDLTFDGMIGFNLSCDIGGQLNLLFTLKFMIKFVTVILNYNFEAHVCKLLDTMSDERQ
jgi:hypothetical protein